MKQFNKQSIHTESLLFVVKALATKKSGKSVNLEHVYCDGSDIVATDGHRLHVYTPDLCPLESGYYAVIKKTKSEIILHKTDLDCAYPDYKRIIPTTEHSKGFKFIETGGKSLPPSEHSKLAQVIRAFTQNTVDIDYFRDASPGMTEYQVIDDTKPLLLIGKNIKAVIMPVRC